MDYQKYKDENNAWIDPYGEFYPCDFMGHEEWARDYLADKGEFVDPQLFEVGVKHLDYHLLKKKTGHAYANEYLCSKGWIRLLTWSNSIGPKVVGGSTTQKSNKDQENTLLDWCFANKKDYNKILDVK